MKDYSENFIGNRTSKYEENDCIDVFCKKDIDRFLSDLYENVSLLSSVSTDENYDGDYEITPIETTFKLGYAQAKRDILNIIDAKEISMLNHADEFLNMKGEQNGD